MGIKAQQETGAQDGGVGAERPGPWREGSPSGHKGAGDRSTGWGVGAQRPGPRGVGDRVRTVATGHPE